MAVASAMPEHESSQVLELDYRVVRESGRLIALLALDTYSNMGRLDHIDIVKPIADSKRQLTVLQ